MPSYNLKNQNRVLIALLALLLVIIVGLSFLVYTLNNRTQTTTNISQIDNSTPSNNQLDTTNQNNVANVEEMANEVENNTEFRSSKFARFNFSYNSDVYNVVENPSNDSPESTINVVGKNDAKSIFSFKIGEVPKSMLQSNMTFFCAEQSETRIVNPGIQNSTGLDELGYFTNALISVNQTNGTYSLNGEIYKDTDFRFYGGTYHRVNDFTYAGKTIQDGYCVDSYGLIYEEKQEDGNITINNVYLIVSSESNIELSQVDAIAATASFSN